MRRNVRFVHLAWLGVTCAGAAIAACSLSDDGTGSEGDNGDAGSDVLRQDVGSPPDVVSADQITTDGEIPDGGPACKTAGCALAIAAGPFHTCAVLGDHTVKCWGDNKFGELGSGTVVGTTVTPGQSTALVTVTGVADAVGIAGGGESNTSAFTCAIVTGGAVRCWGSNGFSQLGPGLDAAVSTTGNIVPADASATAIDLGFRHGCLVDSAGTVRCWGSNTYGERGTPTVLGAVPLDGGATSMSAGFFTTCAVVDGRPVCMGYNGFGQAAPAVDAATVPISVVDAGGVVSAVSASTGFTCATLDAAVSCWGTNTASQLGRTATLAQNQPGSPSFTPGILPTSVTAGGAHACAIMADRGVNCWGANGKGQAGDFTGKAIVATPSGVGGVGKAVALALGNEHSCALTESGDIFCWGSNTRGQLGPNAIAAPDGGDAAVADGGGTDNVAHPDPVKIPL